MLFIVLILSRLFLKSANLSAVIFFRMNQYEFPKAHSICEAIRMIKSIHNLPSYPVL